jgi:hypothetical protein
LPILCFLKASATLRGWEEGIEPLLQPGFSGLQHCRMPPEVGLMHVIPGAGELGTA